MTWRDVTYRGDSRDPPDLKNQKTMFALAKTKIQNSNNCKVLLKSGWKVWESLETHFTQILNEMCQQIWNPCDRKLWIIRI